MQCRAASAPRGWGSLRISVDLDGLEQAPASEAKGCLGGGNVRGAPEEEAGPAEELVADQGGRNWGEERKRRRRKGVV